MRWRGRGVALALWGAAAACSEIADRGLAARAGPWTLSEDRLAELLAAAQPFPLEAGPARELARHWEGAAALALRWAAGDSLLGSEAAAMSAWADRREALWAVDLEGRFGEQAAVSADSAVRIYEEGELRLVAHVLRRAPDDAPARMRTLQQRVAERILAELLAGGSWALAVQESEDERSRDGSGLLGVTARGELPPSLDRAAFRLGPGEVSRVVQSAEGFHVVYRPRFEEVPLLFARGVGARRLAELGRQADQEARRVSGLAAHPRAPSWLARIARRPGDWLESRQPLASWQGGALGVAASARDAADATQRATASWQAGALLANVVARAVLSLPEGERADLASADESVRMRFVEELAAEEMRLAAARERGVALSPELERAFERTHADEIEYWTLALRLSEVGAPSREALARHMEDLVSRRSQARSIPPLLGAWLARRAGARIRDEGVLAAVTKARRAVEGGRN